MIILFRSYASYNKSSRLKKAEKIIKIISKYKNINKSKILDIGCGSGYLGDVFWKKGDPQAAQVNYGKAVKQEPKRLEVYPKYVRSLVASFEFDQAFKTIQALRELGAQASTLDRLYGEWYLKQDRLIEAIYPQIFHS